MSLVTIRQAAEASGVSAKMIRHYERIGLIGAPARAENHYRHYTPREVHELGFIRRARDLGFPLEDIRLLLGLWRDRARPSAEVKRIALRHIAQLDEKTAALAAMSRTLAHLAAHCHGDARPDCPILGALDGDGDPRQAHDAWFRAKVREALADTRPTVPHQRVMDQAQALIDNKRRARA